MAAAFVTADTMIFYWLGSGLTTKADVAKADELLCATPVNVIEILAGIGTPQEWTARKAAASAIVKYADCMRFDTEEHLVRVFKRNPDLAQRPDASLWWQACKALACAGSEDELRKGVSDQTDQVQRNVKPEVAANLKDTHYSGFVDDIARVCDGLLPGYGSTIGTSAQAPIVAKGDRKNVRDSLRSVEWVVGVFTAGLGQRYALAAGQPPDLFAPETAQIVIDLAPYCALYGEYLLGLITERRKPDRNDWGDLELFMYLQPGTFVATGEEKWAKFAGQAGLKDRARFLKPRDLI